MVGMHVVRLWGLTCVVALKGSGHLEKGFGRSSEQQAGRCQASCHAVCAASPAPDAAAAPWAASG